MNEASQNIVDSSLSTLNCMVNDSSQDSAEAVVRIPLSYVLQAKPLISFLVSNINSIDLI